jgi:RNA polymerase sigma-70 factor (ECF subfamily)
MHDRPFPFAFTRDSIAAVRTEDFTAAVQRHQHELRRHCVRLTGSRADADDALQEALLRAWRARRSQVSSFPRAWLYRIATNACFDLLARRDATVVALDDAPGLAAPPEEGPDAATLTRETLELTLLTAIQHLPRRQRAVLIMRDVLGWPADEVASALSITVPAVNSALQRARRSLHERLGAGRLEWTRETPCPQERAILDHYLSALA